MPKAETPNPIDLKGKVLITKAEGLELIDARSGDVVASTPTSHGDVWPEVHENRAYFTTKTTCLPGGARMGAYAWPSGKPIWGQKTRLVCESRPVPWGKNVVFYAIRRPTTGTNRSVVESDLRIYDPKGKLLFSDSREKNRWSSLFSTQGKDLYIIEKGKLKAYQLL